MRFILSIITILSSLLVPPNQLNANNENISTNTSELLTIIPQEWKPYPKIYPSTIQQNGCESAICTEDEKGLYTKILKNIKFETIICKEAICTSESLPVLPDLLNWKIIERDPTKPLGDYCKDAICIQPMGKVMGGDAESDADLERIRKAKENVEREQNEAKQRFSEAKKAKEDLESKRKKAEEKEKKNKEKVAKAKLKVDRQFKESQEFNSLKREEEDRIKKVQKELEEKVVSEKLNELNRKKEQDRIDYQKNQLDLQVERDKKDSFNASFELNMYRTLYRNDLKEAKNTLRKAEQHLDDARYELELQQRSARDATGLFQAESNINPFGKYFLTVCRAAGSSCVFDKVDGSMILPNW